MSEPLIFHAGDNITIKDGYYAEVQFKKIETTKDAVLDKLIALDQYGCKTGDITELKILAKAARHGSTAMAGTTRVYLQGDTGSSQGTNRDQSRDSDVES